MLQMLVHTFGCSCLVFATSHWQLMVLSLLVLTEVNCSTLEVSYLNNLYCQLRANPSPNPTNPTSILCKDSCKEFTLHKVYQNTLERGYTQG